MFIVEMKWYGSTTLGLTDKRPNLKSQKINAKKTKGQKDKRPNLHIRPKYKNLTDKRPKRHKAKWTKDQNTLYRPMTLDQ